jgi:pimeloyl-ACP methyl ester carboxylesterase
MPTLHVEGASLYYETFGSGPLLLFIPGADGRGAIFHDVAKILSAQFTVVCWDRRGYSQSNLIGAQDFANRMSTDADDANSLIMHLGAPAFVFGTSSGALVATRLLERHPDSVRALVSHEPPAFSILPEEHRLKASGLMQHIYDVYRAKGPAAAMEVFTGGLFSGDDGPTMRHCTDTTRGHEIRANVLFWFEFELRQYTAAPVDLEAIFKVKEKYIPVAGVVSGDGAGIGPIAVIAGTIGKEVTRFPGGHVPVMTHVEEFAQALENVLKNF